MILANIRKKRRGMHLARKHAAKTVYVCTMDKTSSQFCATEDTRPGPSQAWWVCRVCCVTHAFGAVLVAPPQEVAV